MNEFIHAGLLPAGLADLLPPEATFESRLTEALMECFRLFGYQRVKPPLIEFEENLISGSGQATAAQTFRLMDPVSQRMLGVRPDMTLQVARIATTRLSDDPRPLRLSYAGQVLRVKGSSLRPERQFSQVGAELIGSSQPGADAEIIAMAAEALISLGARDLSVDLGMPRLIKILSGELGFENPPGGNPPGENPPGKISKEAERLRAALGRKDVEEIAALGGRAADIFGSLLSAVGPARPALAVLHGLDLPAAATAEIEHLSQVVALTGQMVPGLKLTVDPVETRGYEYHTGITFTFFSLGVNQELGRGGRYLAGLENSNTDWEPATGITFFLDCVAHAVPRPAREDRLFLPHGTTRDQAADPRAQGWAAIMDLDGAADPEGEARRMGCTHILTDKGIREIAEKKGEGS